MKFMMETGLLTALLLVVLTPAHVSSNYDTSMVHRLMQDRDVLIQDGLSYFNGTTLHDVIAHDEGTPTNASPSASHLIWTAFQFCIFSVF